MLFVNIFFFILMGSLFVYSTYLFLFWIGFFLPRKYFSVETPKVSVIVAARNEEKNIERCIAALCNQSYAAELFEVIIVNDQSEDATESIVKSLQKKYKNLILINSKNRPENYAPKKFAITKALKIASGEIILTTDADITVQRSWIESIVSYFQKEIGLVVGFSRIRENEINSWFQKFEALDFLMLMTATKGSIRAGIPISCSGQNLSFRKSAFEEIGGFDDSSSKQSSDDVLLLHKMRRSKKWKIAFAEDRKSYVETDASKSLTAFLKQRIRWAAMGVGQFSKSLNLTVISITTALVNIGLLSWIFIVLLFPFIGTFTLIIAVLVKLIIDLIVALTGCIYFQKKSWLSFFPFLFILYMPYILIISIFSLFGNFQWKERVYTQGKVN